MRNFLLKKLGSSSKKFSSHSDRRDGKLKGRWEMERGLQNLRISSPFLMAKRGRLEAADLGLDAVIDETRRKDWGREEME